MAYLLQWQDAFIFVMYGFLTYAAAHNKSQFETCHAPIATFIIATYIFILIQQLSSIFLRRQQIRKPTKFYYINLTFYLSLFIPCLCMTIKGISWQLENEKYSPLCLPRTNPRWVIWMLIGLLGIWDIYFAILYGIMANNLRHYFITRPRMNRLLQRQSENKRLLDNENPADEYDNTQIELPEIKVDELRVSEYAYSFIKSLNPLQKTCPICFDNILPQTEIAELPHCNHIFHSTCIKTWLEKSAICPVCVLEAKGIVDIQSKSSSKNTNIELSEAANQV